MQCTMITLMHQDNNRISKWMDASRTRSTRGKPQSSLLARTSQRQVRYHPHSQCRPVDARQPCNTREMRCYMFPRKHTSPEDFKQTMQPKNAIMWGYPRAQRGVGLWRWNVLWNGWAQVRPATCWVVSRGLRGRTVLLFRVGRGTC